MQISAPSADFLERRDRPLAERQRLNSRANWRAHPSTTTLTSEPNPSQVGQSFTFTAAVNGAVGTPTGSVAIYEGATLLGNGTLSSGGATFMTSTLGIGPHAITATYGGDVNFIGSSSSILNVTVSAIRVYLPLVEK